MLLTSELVTNAVVYAGTPIVLVIQRSERGVRVEVHDDNPALPERRDAAEVSKQTGRGLWLVDRLADRWGALPHHGDCKSVWFEVDAPTR